MSSLKIYLIFSVFEPDYILLPLFSHTLPYMPHSTAKAYTQIYKYMYTYIQMPRYFPVDITKFSTS